MANLIASNKLSSSIKSFHTASAKLNATAHLLACSAVMLAANDGRTDWLNQLYTGLTPINQGAFKAWLSPASKAFFGEEGKEHRWLSFESTGKDGKAPAGFKVVKGTEALRPSAERIKQVADDLSLAFFNKTVETATKQNESYDIEALIKRMTGLASSIEKAATEGKIVVPTSLIQNAKEFAVTMQRNIKLATVDGKPVEQEVKAEAPKTRSNRKAAMAKQVA